MMMMTMVSLREPIRAARRRMMGGGEDWFEAILRECRMISDLRTRPMFMSLVLVIHICLLA